MDNPYQAPSADLNTSHGLESLKYVGFWARAGAYVVDSLLMMVIVLPIIYFMVGGIDELAMAEESPGMGLMIVMYLLPIALVISFWIWKGSTPGKMIFNAKIVDAKTGGHPSTLQFIGRYLGYIISSIPFCLGFMWVGWDKRKQGWHDKMSGTIVVSPSNDPSKQISFDE